MATVGFFHNGNAASFTKQFDAFADRLRKSVRRTTVDIDHRWAGSDPARTDRHLNELIAKGVKVLVAAGGPQSALAAQKATADNRIPVVFTSVTDPVGLGLVAAPGKSPTNLTGVAGLTSELDWARLELLHELLGDGAMIGVLLNPARPQADAHFKKLDDDATSRLKLPRLVRQNATNLGEIEKAFAATRGKVQGLLVTADSLFNNLRKEVVALADGMPAVYQWREFAEIGGYMSFGPGIIEAYEQVADYVKLILEDEKQPSDLPVLLPSRFELVINIDTAYAGGFKIPTSLLSRAQFVRTI